jgi:hypothetical protein
MPHESTSRKISVYPTKGFFIQTLVKDIQLIDAFLDLIDNSIDSYIENNISDRRLISISFSNEQIIIEDKCGGIKKDNIYDKVFRFGKTTERRAKTIGVYGIGMKRAIFKMGKSILIESDDGDNYFVVKINEDWLKDEENWELDFEKEETSKGASFTKITITDLYPNISDELSTTFENQLRRRIKDTYSIFIENNVTIQVNEIQVEPYDFSFLYNDAFVPFHKKYTFGEVIAEIYAGFTPPPDGEKDEIFGWYVFCNNRLVIKNDTSSKTGWGGPDGKIYHYPEDNRFLGLLFLNSDNPSELPWHTTKEDIQEDSKIYRQAQIHMRAVTNRLVEIIRIAGRTIDPESGQRIGGNIFRNIPIKSRKEIVGETNEILPSIKGDPYKVKVYYPKTTTIAYSKDKDIVKKVKAKLGDSYMSNRELGEKTFDYFVDMEEIKDE